MLNHVGAIYFRNFLCICTPLLLPPLPLPPIYTCMYVYTHICILCIHIHYTLIAKNTNCSKLVKVFFFLNHLCFVRNNLPVFFGKVNVNLLQDLCEYLHLDLHLGMQFNILLCGQDYGDPYFVKCLQYYFYNQGKN